MQEVGAEGAGPAFPGLVVARQSYRRGNVNPLPVAGHSQACEKVVGQRVDLPVVVGILCGPVAYGLPVGVMHQSLSHGRYPQRAVVIGLDVEHAWLLPGDYVNGVVLTVTDVSAAHAIGAYPDPAALVFGERHYCHGHSGDGVGEELPVAVELIETTHVGAYPDMAVAGKKHTVDAVVADAVSHAQPRTLIVQRQIDGRLHVDPFLEHRYPDIACHVLGYRLYLAMADVGKVAEERIGDGMSGARVVGNDARAICSGKEHSVAGNGETLYRHGC